MQSSCRTLLVGSFKPEHGVHVVPSVTRKIAGALFVEAERMPQEDQPQFDLLYSLQGFRYCDWLLAPAEQASWQHLLALSGWHVPGP